MAKPDGLEFLAEGRAFQGGKYDLRVVEHLLTDYRRLVDLTLPLVLGQKVISDRLREQVNYQVSFKEGSWLTFLEFVLENRDILPNFSAADGASFFIPDQISRLIHVVLELRRWFEEQITHGKKPKISLASDNSIDMPINLHNIQNKGGKIVIQPIVIIAAEATRSTLDSLINSVDGDKVKSLSLRANKVQSVIRSADRRITGTLKQELPKAIDVVGRLNVVNFDGHRGQLVTESSTFPVTWDESIRRDIHRFADTDGIVFTVKPIIDNKKFQDEPVGLHILRVNPSQRRLL